jgi:hypothetical protein
MGGCFEFFTGGKGGNGGNFELKLDDVLFYIFTDLSRR